MRFNLLIFIIFVGLCCGCGIVPNADAQGYSTTTQEANDQSGAFLSVMGDIPLMDGLQELDLDTLVFDKPSGRIVQATAVGKGVKASSIAQFYRQTLPQLGWRNVAPNIFVREGEVLEIETVDSGDYGTVHFSVKPQ